MLKSCKYCGRIHDSKYDCGRRPKRGYRTDKVGRFRSSRIWARKREQIRVRDKQLCQICIRRLYGTTDQYTYDRLEVHHAVSLADDFDRRLDDDNLLTCCVMHHKMADRGEIPQEVIQEIIQEQEIT
jgi:5-methylcytosine-specific restriction endonuclease McrA